MKQHRKVLRTKKEIGQALEKLRKMEQLAELLKFRKSNNK